MYKYTKEEFLDYLRTQENLDNAIDNIDHMDKNLIIYDEPEIWKDIDGFEGKYKISNYGNVKSFVKYPNGMRMTLLKDRYGYPKIGLGSRIKHERKYPSIHILVATAFVPNPDNLPTVNHGDGDKTNNYYKNLGWCTHGYNNKHAYEIGIREGMSGEKNPNANLTENIVKEIYMMAWGGDHTHKQIADMFGIRYAMVGNIKHKRTWKNFLNGL
jgi:hypothetical protein